MMTKEIMSSGTAQGAHAPAKKLRVIAGVMLALLTLCLVMTAPVGADVDMWIGDVATSFSGGDGTANSPFQIATGAELAYLAQGLDVDKSANYTLINNIDLDNNPWIPIPEFTGTFDGDGFVISNLNVTTTNGQFLGLFGTARGASIKNVNLCNISITGFCYIGGLVGGAYSGTSIDNCHLYGTIKLEATTTNPNYENGYIGGLVGYGNGAYSVSSSSVIGDTESYVKATGGANYNVGGLVGGSQHCSTSFLTDVIADISVSGSTRIGGLIGTVRNSVVDISGASAHGTITVVYSSKDAGKQSVGGLVGIYENPRPASISDSSATSEIQIEENAANTVTVSSVGLIGTTNKNKHVSSLTDSEKTAVTNSITDSTYYASEETLNALKDAGSDLTTGEPITPTVESHVITAIANDGGSLSPSGKVGVEANNDLTITITPDEGYSISQILIDGNAVGIAASYTFTDVTADHTITVSFSSTPTSPTVSEVSQSSSGTPTPGAYFNYPRTVTDGGLVEFGTSKVVKSVTLPAGSSGKVNLHIDSTEYWPLALDSEFTFDISVEKLGEGTSYISFKIAESKLTALELTAADIGVYHEVNGEWVKLVVTYTIEDGTVLYTAETDSFSPFKLVIEEGAAVQKEEEVTPSEPVTPPVDTLETPVTPDEPEVLPPVDTPETPETPEEPASPAPVLAVLAALGAAIVLRRK